eukprot:9598170-Heterocapsa_arctica.AAC.1
MLKYWPNKGVVMIKATKEMFKRKLEDLTGGPHRKEDKQPHGWGKADDKGASHSYARGGAWTGDSRASPAKPGNEPWTDWGTKDQGSDQKPKQATARYDNQGRLQPAWS